MANVRAEGIKSSGNQKALGTEKAEVVISKLLVNSPLPSWTNNLELTVIFSLAVKIISFH